MHFAKQFLWFGDGSWGALRGLWEGWSWKSVKELLNFLKTLKRFLGGSERGLGPSGNTNRLKTVKQKLKKNIFKLCIPFWIVFWLLFVLKWKSILVRIHCFSTIVSEVDLKRLRKPFFLYRWWSCEEVVPIAEPCVFSRKLTFAVLQKGS